MVLGTVVVLVAFPFYRWMALAFGVQGLAWAGVAGMTLNGLATLLLAHRCHGAPKAGALLVSALRAAILAGAAWAGAYFGSGLVLGRVGHAALVTLPAGTGGAVAELFLTAGIFGLVVVLLLPWLGDAELRAAITRRLPRRLGGR
jgi:hypothetical protein